MLFSLLVACSGGGGSDEGGATAGDDARRAVLKDIGEQVILPSLRDFDAKVAVLKIKVDALAGAPGNATARAEAQQAWRDAMASWQRNEVLQVGPAGRSSGTGATAGGANLRDLIYAFPLLQLCQIDQAAYAGQAVTASSPVNTTGLGALEYLLFATGTNPSCPPDPGVDAVDKRAKHAKKIADRIGEVATDLRNRWEPVSGNFLAQWSNAGAGSAVYTRPQDALNALSMALFYVEQQTKDRKIALTTGIGSTDFTCNNTTGSCPEFLESRLSRHSGANIRANVQVFKDVFTGLNGKLGVNSLLEGISRADLATRIVNDLNAVLAQSTAVENSGGFDAAVEGIDTQQEKTECGNASSSSTGLPPCALHGLIRTAMSTFRSSIVSALSLAIPADAASDAD